MTRESEVRRTFPVTEGMVAITDGSARREPGRYLIVTFDGGGNVQPAFGLGRRLRSRGHEVRVLANAHLRARAEAAGCKLRPLPASCDLDPSKGRALEDDDQEAYLVELLTGSALAEAVLGEAERDRPDVMIVDCMLRNGLIAAEICGLPTSALVHTRYGFYFGDDHDPEEGWDWGPVNSLRVQLGLSAIAPTHEPRAAVEQWKRCERTLVVVPREFEMPRAAPPSNVRYVGPIFEEEVVADWPEDLPWSPGHPDPLVLVSLSSTYMHHEDVLARILEGLSELDVRILVTLGGGLEPREVTALPGVEVRTHVPHRAVLRHTSLLVTHAGMGTAMAGFAEGVPMICTPLGRDQDDNAAQIQALGAGRVIPQDASPSTFRDAAAAAIASHELRTGAHRMAEIVNGYRDGARAVEELETILDTSRPRDPL